MSKIVGVLGGLGPETTAGFYLRLIKLGTSSTRPAICIWSVPLELEKEAEYIKSGRNKDYYLALLQKGARALESAGAEIVAIPCNTVHEFYGAIANAVKIPIINLIEIVAKEAVSRGWDHVLLLATSRTLETRLYHSEFEKLGISVLVPNASDQEQLNQLIDKLLNGKADFHSSQQMLKELMGRYECSQVILACTDLQLIFPTGIDSIDSMDALARHTAGILTGG